ncbi:MAG: AAA family ATPase, partial [Thermodesulfobacteriota bacterium]
MLIYAANKKEFRKDVLSNRIEDKILTDYQDRTGYTTSQSEIRAWRNSMQYMNNLLVLTKIPDDTGVAIEYRIPQSSKRIDFILTGKDQHRRDMAIIVELKQWSKVGRTEKDAVVRTFLQKRECEVEHPSYQAWTYSALLHDFNETVRKEDIQLQSCAYLHNCESYDVINHSFYSEHTSKAPSFLKQDTQKLSDFIRSFIKYGDADKIMYRIDNGKISPSKNLADQLA